MSVIPGLAGVAGLIQDNTLYREYKDQLFPHLLFRADARPEVWEAHQGDTVIHTRGSDLDVITTPLTAGVDPIAVQENFEQWKLTMCQYGNSMNTNMQLSRAALADKFIRNTRTLALNAGKSLNILVRNKLFIPYLAGNTHANNAGAGTTVEVGSISGFQEVIVDGELKDVSATNTKNIFLGAAATPAIVTASAATDPAFPLGQGTLTLQASAAWSAGDIVVAEDATIQRNAGGGAGTDSIAITDVLTVEDIQEAIATLRNNDVPRHDDGYYHVHVDPQVLSSLYRDSEWQNINQSLFNDLPYKMFLVNVFLGSAFYENTQMPKISTVGALQASRPGDAPNAQHGVQIGADVRNKAGVAISRTIVTGGNTIFEKWVPEMEFLTEAGVTGKVGTFQTININAMAVDFERIRYTLRSAQDRLGQMVAHTWSFTGDWGIPSDLNGGVTAARFKRAIVINSGSAG